MLESETDLFFFFNWKLETEWMDENEWMPQAAKRDALSLHWVEDIWVAHARRVDQVNNKILSASRNHHPALWISLFAYTSLLTPAYFKISWNAINHWKVFFFFSNSNSVEHTVRVTRYVRGITCIFYHCLFRTPNHSKLSRGLRLSSNICI